MQDRYVGDIGDYAKYSLINALSTDRNLGIAWYYYPNEGHNNDGKHITYLAGADKWENKDPTVFKKLKLLIDRGQRNLHSIEQLQILNARAYAREILSNNSGNYCERSEWRKGWFDRVQNTLQDCSIVFADPDNGLCLTSTYKSGNRKMWKRIPVSEVNALSRGRPAIIYHHNTRFKGGHENEIKYWIKQLNSKLAIRVRYGSSRTFFLINADTRLVDRAKHWALNFDASLSKIQIFEPEN
ncbi:hypothetical protein GCM10008927_20120 [Amylibacter ulvae]|uniref:Uncharacterized protein n=1 Tax=Paramylibacter ulvae TaxID=1651968 RepID=A0ABQ3D4H2_9RHOB|nr:hypothetical protein [Amylibacter ulvae]GHA54300.1 hypothetical protein GCM10008927_20120 [Amylibacter ulvae]